jgi:DNA polymerase V
MDYYALVDCNNFYASCERVFNPSIRQAPVIVLSNNDGCVIARSQEAKAIGIQMTTPFFECREMIKKHNVAVFSSNYALYGDMSARVMDILSGFTPELEVYSIDEAFLRLRGYGQFNLDQLAQNMSRTVQQQTGIPVSVGIGRTKTLAKAANYLAKKVYKTGAFCLREPEGECLKMLSVGDVWGIGRQRAQWLLGQGIASADDLRKSPDRFIKDHLTITGLRTVWELRGTPCLVREETYGGKKAVGCSRMFGYRVTKLGDLQEAVASYIAQAAVKLRKQRSLAGYLQVYAESKPHGDSQGSGILIDPPSASTPLLSHYAQIILNRIFKEGCSYKKAGVQLMGLVSEQSGQQCFTGPPYCGTRTQKLMQTVDRYNAGASGGKIQFAAEGLQKPWHMKQTFKSKRYTTRWDELLVIDA